MSKDKIRDLNDAFRRSIVTDKPLGKIYMSNGIDALGHPIAQKAIHDVATFEAFTEDIDPHGEHDMVRVVVDGVTLWAKIDYFDKRDPDLGAEDPSNAATTERVMTIMLPEEY